MAEYKCNILKMLFCNVDLNFLIELHLQVCLKKYEKDFHMLVSMKWIKAMTYLFSFYQNVNAIDGLERTRTNEREISRCKERRIIGKNYIAITLLNPRTLT
jgi:hypothetical protein